MNPEFKGTPSPWGFTKVNGMISVHQADHDLEVDDFDDGFSSVCGIYNCGDINDADASLIATAPELLIALQKAQSLIEKYIHHLPTGKIRNEVCDVNIESLSAINKALGE